MSTIPDRIREQIKSPAFRDLLRRQIQSVLRAKAKRSPPLTRHTVAAMIQERVEEIVARLSTFSPEEISHTARMQAESTARELIQAGTLWKDRVAEIAAEEMERKLAERELPDPDGLEELIRRIMSEEERLAASPGTKGVGDAVRAAVDERLAKLRIPDAEAIESKVIEAVEARLATLPQPEVPSEEAIRVIAAEAAAEAVAGLPEAASDEDRVRAIVSERVETAFADRPEPLTLDKVNAIAIEAAEEKLADLAIPDAKEIESKVLEAVEARLATLPQPEVPSEEAIRAIAAEAAAEAAGKIPRTTPEEIERIARTEVEKIREGIAIPEIPDETTVRNWAESGARKAVVGAVGMQIRGLAAALEKQIYALLSQPALFADPAAEAARAEVEATTGRLRDEIQEAVATRLRVWLLGELKGIREEMPRAEPVRPEDLVRAVRGEIESLLSTAVEERIERHAAGLKEELRQEQEEAVRRAEHNALERIEARLAHVPPAGAAAPSPEAVREGVAEAVDALRERLVTEIRERTAAGAAEGAERLRGELRNWMEEGTSELRERLERDLAETIGARIDEAMAARSVASGAAAEDQEAYTEAADRVLRQMIQTELNTLKQGILDNLPDRLDRTVEGIVKSQLAHWRSDLLSSPQLLETVQKTVRRQLSDRPAAVAPVKGPNGGRRVRVRDRGSIREHFLALRERRHRRAAERKWPNRSR